MELKMWIDFPSLFAGYFINHGELTKTRPGSRSIKTKRSGKEVTDIGNKKICFCTSLAMT
jgi:hypothetical protein